MQTMLALTLGLYLLVYVFEGPVRYVLNMAGADSLIFVRDIVLLLPVVFLGGQQFLQRTLHPAYLVYCFVVALHGTVLVLNVHSFEAAVYGTKMLSSMLVGAVLAPFLLQPGRRFLLYIGILWISVLVGVLLDKYYVQFPWVGLSTTIGDVKVDISRDWDIQGEAKRAGGFLRSSIHAATVAPLFALILILHLRNLPVRLLVAVLTIFVINWTTQKGALIAYLMVLLLLACWPRRPLPMLRGGYLFFLLLAIALPTILPGYFMPEASSGGFSNMSFNLRVEQMWPKAWEWIAERGTFPFGVGLGGISGAQMLYARESFNAADNIFVFMFASFGVMTLFYLLAITLGVFRLPANGSRSDTHAVAILLFVACYGCVLSMLEDQMASLFLGAAICWVIYESKRRRAQDVGLSALSGDQNGKAPENGKVIISS